MTRPAFNTRALIAGYRAACAAHGLDSLTGNPVACSDPGWWKRVDYWADAGPAHSVVEAEALRSIAAQARACVPGPRVMTYPEAPGLISDVFRETAECRPVQQALIPLAELHRRQGVEVITLEGVRMTVPIKKTA